MKQFYITTAIDYANGAPHIGHAYEKVLTDVIARHRRLRGERVHFLTGLDEHGQKVQQTAERLGVDPQKQCDEVAEKFIAMCAKLEISYSDYIRTTEERHKKVVSQLLQKLFDQGEIYKAQYAGFYSPKEEQFLQEKDKVEGKWPERFGEVIEITEENYFFKLSKYQDWLIDYIKKNPDWIFPAYRAKDILEFLNKEPLNDLCISRPKSRLSWGIPLPFDEEYVTYVWFDALINYISAVGYGTESFEKNWPADYHVIGKDILVPAHGVYWPIMLKAMGIALPKAYIVHGWWMIAGDKMSKSKGNIINPLDLMDKFGADPLRFFLMKEMNVGKDSDFTQELFLRDYNSHLGNDLGNLVSRLLNMASRYTEGKVPAPHLKEEPENEIFSAWGNSMSNVLKLYDELAFHKAIDQVIAFLSAINKYAETRAPWKLAKSEDPEDRKRLETSLFYMAEGLRVAALALTPIMPGVSKKIIELLGEKEITAWGKSLQLGEQLVGNTLGEKTILFPRVELEV